jgi:peptidoglycan/LPS O-acetylase OafA/YrhL
MAMPGTASTGAATPGVERRRETPTTGLERGRSSGLDGLRAFAALLVALFHLHTVNGVSFGPLDRVIGGGDSGVWLFFALSGYLLYKPFVRGPVDLGGFALKRAGRIVPGYVVALVGLTVLTGSQLPIRHPLPYLTVSSAYDIPLRGFLGNAWTLSAEILFYLTLPWIARLARGHEVRVLLTFGLASAALATIQRFAITDANAWLTGTYPLSFSAFVPGMLLAVLEVRRPAAFSYLAHPAFLVFGAFFVVLGTLTNWLPVAVFTGLGTALLMGCVLQHRLPFAKALGFAGGASYALYLWHKDLYIAFGPVLGLAGALVAAALSWALVERPILRWIHWLALGRPAPVAPPDASSIGRVAATP